MSKNDWKHLRCGHGEGWRVQNGQTNKKCSYAVKNGRRKNNAGTDKEEKKKLAGTLAKKELPDEGCSRTRPSKLRPADLIWPANGFSVGLSRMILSFFRFGF